MGGKHKLRDEDINRVGNLKSGVAAGSSWTEVKQRLGEKSIRENCDQLMPLFIARRSPDI